VAGILDIKYLMSDLRYISNVQTFGHLKIEKDDLMYPFYPSNAREGEIKTQL